MAAIKCVACPLKSATRKGCPQGVCKRVTEARSLTPSLLRSLRQRFEDLESRWINGSWSTTAAEAACERLKSDFGAAEIAGYRANNGVRMSGEEKSAFMRKCFGLKKQIHQFCIAMRVIEAVSSADPKAERERRKKWQEELDAFTEAAWRERESRPHESLESPLSPTRLSELEYRFEALKNRWLAEEVNHDQALLERGVIHQTLHQCRVSGYLADDGSSLDAESHNALRREGNQLGANLVALRSAIQMTREQPLGGDEAGQVRRLNWTRAADDSAERREPGRLF